MLRKGFVYRQLFCDVRVRTEHMLCMDSIYLVVAHERTSGRSMVQWDGLYKYVVSAVRVVVFITLAAIV
jgi:hypothetical protein